MNFFKLFLILVVGILSISISDAKAQPREYLCNYSELSGGQVKFYKGTPATGLVYGTHPEGGAVEIAFIDGKPDGITRVYYPNGKLKMEIPVKTDGPEGVTKSYDMNGVLQMEASSKQGELSGVTKIYQNGKLFKETIYENNIPNGEEKYYRENGELFITITYKNGTILSGFCHKQEGIQVPLTEKELVNWSDGKAVICN